MGADARPPSQSGEPTMPESHPPARSLAAAVLCLRALGAVACATALLAVPVRSFAQETTTEIGGVVADPDGAPVVAARVTITHLPTGTVATTLTNDAGYFTRPGLRPGGPYRVRIEADGYQPQVLDSVYTQLGNPAAVDALLEPTELLAEVAVSARREQLVEIGSGTEFAATQVAALPSLQRDLKDVIRLDPKVVLDPANLNAISVAGASTRYNTLTIDGVRQSDDFGLNANGYPTTRAPISLEAIDALAVQTAPYSLEYSGFQGGTINVVTKSGSNDFHGSAYAYYNSDALAGRRSGELPVRLSFEERNYGASLGGPILADRLFFFASYERTRSIAPVPVGAAGAGFPASVAAVPVATYDRIVALARSVYGFDPLATPHDLPETDTKALVKLDWQLADGQRAVIQYQYNDGNTVVQNNSNVAARSVGTPSDWYDRPIRQSVYTLQWFSSWSDALSTEFKAARKHNTTGQYALGAAYSEFDVCVPDGGGSTAVNQFRNGACATGTVYVGPDVFRHANQLTNDLDTLKLKATYLAGRHSLAVGVEREHLDVFDLFVPTSRGQYVFGSLDEFQARSARQLTYSNAVTNDVADAAARYAATNTGVYLQDRWQPTAEFAATAGVRFERWTSGDRPLLNAGFRARYGFDNTATLDGRGLTLPRVGFDWRLAERTTLRGGVGLFGGGAPNVWLANSYSATGVITATQVIDPGKPLAAVLQGVDGARLPQAVLDAQRLLAGTGSVNALDPQFRLPSVYKYSVALERLADLGWLGRDWRLTGELIYTDTRDGVLWRDLRLAQTGIAPDGRPLYGYRATDPAGGARSTSVNDLLLTNTDRGSSLVATLDAAKSWQTRAGRVDLAAAYAYTDARDVNPGTSSTALSNWDNVAASDPNHPGAATSNYGVRHRFVLNVAWQKAFVGSYLSSAVLYLERRSGQPFSYTFGNQSSVFGDPRQRARQRELFYVPKDAGDVELAAGGPSWAELDAYIRANGLDRYRGQIVPRNAFSSPWWTSADLRLAQEVPGLFRGAKGVVSLDIINLANLLNSRWGRYAEVGFPYVWPVVNATINPVTGRYVYSALGGGGLAAPSYGLVVPQVSVWRMNLGLRYQF